MSESYRVINVIRQAIDQEVSNGAKVHRTPGVIHASSGYFVSAYIWVDELLEEVTLPAGVHLNSGDYAIIATNDEGSSWVERIIPKTLYSKMVLDYNNARLGIGDGATNSFAFGSAGQVLKSGGAGSAYWGESSGGVTDHGALTGLADDDHAQYLKEKASGGTAVEVPEHAHAAAASAGTVDHGALTGRTDDDHTQYLKEKASGGTAIEVPAHTHANADNAGTVAHSATTGRTANDHHNQSHVLNGADHTVSGLTSGQFLRATGATTFGFQSITAPIVNTPYTANGTWTKPAGLSHIIVECQGGGGGSGGIASTAANNASASGGGGGGGYARKLIPVASLTGSSYTVAVGAGGLAGASGGGSAAGQGGTSSFSGTGITAVQGGGGHPGEPDAAGSTGNTIQLGGAGGTAVGGDINVPGSDGGAGHTLSMPGVTAAMSTQGNFGGASFFAGSQAPVGNDENAVAGKAYGSGASGANNAQSDANRAGAVGGAGVVIVTEFYV